VKIFPAFVDQMYILNITHTNTFASTNYIINHHPHVNPSQSVKPQQ